MRPIRFISVLMPTWQGIEFLERVLTRLTTQRCDIAWEFSAIDSGSSDGTWELLGEFEKKFPVPFRRRRIDKVEFDHGDTRNRLAALSSGDLLVFLTQDAIPSSDRWLQTLAQNFTDERVGGAYCRNVPRPDCELLTRIFSANDPGYMPGRREVRLPDDTTYALMNTHERRVLYNFNDVASAVRRELWERHPFPRTWFGEDVLMARALLEAGFTIVYDDEATVEHSHDHTPEETHARAAIDARFNAEWLDRICVATKSDARILADRQLDRDREALRAANLSDAEYGRELEHAARLRTAVFEGLHEGGATKKRYPRTRLLEKTRLKVLYVVHGFPPDTWAGTEIYTQNIALEMARRGHEVVVFTRAPASDDAAVDFSVHETAFQGLRVLRMVHRLDHKRLSDSYRQPKAEAAFADVLERERPDIVHFQHLIHLSAGCVDVARERGIATLLTIHDYWSICARVQLIRPDGVRCEENQGAGCFLCVKDKLLEHIPAAKRAGNLLGPMGNFLAEIAGRDEYAEMMARHGDVVGCYQRADLRVSPGRFLRKKLIDTADFDAHTLVFSDNGMRTDHVHALTKKPDSRGRVRFGFVGSLVWYKGGEVMLRAMRRLQGENAVLVVHGDFKPDSDEHHRLLRELAGANVEFKGRFDNANLSKVYAEIDVLIVPSIWFENSPITIHEAFLTHTPVVASNIGGMAEFVRDGVDGLHFEVGDEDDLAEKLSRFVEDRDLVRRLSQDWMEIKTIADDAAVTEARYRALCAIERDEIGETRPRVLLDRAAIEATRRIGSVEQQGADMLLLRADGTARVEFDIRGCGGALRTLRIEQFALGTEPALALGLAVAVDGRRIGEFPAFTSQGVEGVRTHDVELELASDASVLAFEPLTTPSGARTHARLKRIVILSNAQKTSLHA
ncbi:MAG: glycosyltransferase [Planctomycetota bacterium]|nr:glycosyltransferase [Planctomycetota bacterium]